VRGHSLQLVRDRSRPPVAYERRQTLRTAGSRQVGVVSELFGHAGCCVVFISFASLVDRPQLQTISLSLGSSSEC
jgi:hypothetical protein